MVGITGILLALALLMNIAYRGISVLILTPLMAVMAVLFQMRNARSGELHPVFMPAAGGFIILYFPLFLLGAIFGKLMDDSGSAHAIADGPSPGSAEGMP